MNFSFWEKDRLQNHQQHVIIGGGIVGLSTALSITESHKNAQVVIIEPYWPPQGASTKNAGFICFGSLSEILSDTQNLQDNETVGLIKMRYEGAQLLKKRISIDCYQNTGGFELFDEDNFPSDELINKGNQLFEKATGIANYFNVKTNTDFQHFNDKIIHLPGEGMLNPMMMMNQLKTRCVELGVEFIHGFSVQNINSKRQTIQLNNGEELYYRKCVVCTNAFAKSLLPELDIKPARNMVMMVKPERIPFKSGVYHYQEGYYYFRNYKNFVLLGGARNLDPITECTPSFGINKSIQSHLEHFLNAFILPNNPYQIVKTWSGIMGVSDTKSPIIKELDNNLYVGVRLGGMGVAIGSILGKKLANLMARSN